MVFIGHIATWVRDLDNMSEFYRSLFGGIPGAKYHNPVKQFTSIFLSFSTGPRLELMHNPECCRKIIPLVGGYAHIAFSVGSTEAVDRLTSLIRDRGYTVVSEPRVTGDGYYESVITDPEGNLVEITI